jgi:phosphomannomutase
MQRGVRTCTRATGKLVTEMLRFGTDGVRGRVGVDIDETQVARLGAAVARVWPHHAMVIGNDGRSRARLCGRCHHRFAQCVA